MGISNAFWRKEIATAVSPPRNDTFFRVIPRRVLAPDVGISNTQVEKEKRLPRPLRGLAMTQRSCVRLSAWGYGLPRGINAPRNDTFFRVIPRRVLAPDVGISDTQVEKEKRLPRPLRGLAMTQRCCVRLTAWGYGLPRQLCCLAMTPFFRVIPRRVLAPDVGISNAFWRKEIATGLRPSQ